MGGEGELTEFVKFGDDPGTGKQILKTRSPTRKMEIATHASFRALRTASASVLFFRFSSHSRLCMVSWN